MIRDRGKLGGMKKLIWDFYSVESFINYSGYSSGHFQDYGFGYMYNPSHWIIYFSSI